MTLGPVRVMGVGVVVMMRMRTVEVGVKDHHHACVPLNCNASNLPVPANAIVLQLPSCDLAYQSQCTVSCDEGFTSDDVTYLCNVTSDPTMVDWIAINSSANSYVPKR